MRIKAEILLAQDNEFTTKAGKVVKQSIVTLLDRCPESPMRNTFDLVVEGIPAAHFNSNLRGKLVEVDITDFEIWQGRLRASAKIVNGAGSAETGKKTAA